MARTHEVEGALEKVFEEAERLSVSISNTNNSFLMLANTQFVESRTYQDDDESQITDKKPTTEEVSVCLSCVFFI